MEETLKDKEYYNDSWVNSVLRQWVENSLEWRLQYIFFHEWNLE